MGAALDKYMKRYQNSPQNLSDVPYPSKKKKDDDDDEEDKPSKPAPIAGGY